MTEQCTQYINDELFSNTRPVIFTDLMNKFKIGSSDAKSIMYKFYRNTTTNMKFNCVIMMCYQDGTVKLVTELSTSQDQSQNDNLTDCFIYAFNPNNEFIPINDIKDESGSTLIVNPYKLVNNEPVKPAVTKETKPKTMRSHTESTPKTTTTANSTIGSSKTPMRPKTHPITTASTTSTTSTSTAKPKKSMGLRSTELLAKMRRAREEKENERQRELKQRRQEEEASRMERLNKDPKRKQQMDELHKMFVDDSDDDDLLNEQPPTKKTKIDDHELEELLETTAEESLLEIGNKPNQDTNVTKPNEIDSEPEQELEKKSSLGDESIEAIASSYVDDDGYVVTKKQPAPPTKTTRARSSPLKKTSRVTKKNTLPAPKKKIKQGSIESFFKRS